MRPGVPVVIGAQEFEAAREMAVKARAENKALSDRVAALEAKIAELSSGK